MKDTYGYFSEDMLKAVYENADSKSFDGEIDEEELRNFAMSDEEWWLFIK